MNKEILIAFLGFLAGILPKIYELLTKKKKDAIDQQVAFHVALAAESKDIRAELRAEIAVLKDEIDELKETNERLFEQNLKFKTEIAILTQELKVYKLANNVNSFNNTNSSDNTNSNTNNNSNTNTNSNDGSK